MVRKYLGKFAREEKGFLKTKIIYGDLTVEADSFAEAQERVCKQMGQYGIKVCFISPIWREFEK